MTRRDVFRVAAVAVVGAVCPAVFAPKPVASFWIHIPTSSYQIRYAMEAEAARVLGVIGDDGWVCAFHGCDD